MRVAVYLTHYTVSDRLGGRLTITARRLVRATPDDRVIGIVEAPTGSRIRRRRDDHGTEQLLVPIGRTPWSRLFGPKVVIPAKYVLSVARERDHGLSLVESDAAECPA